MLYREAATDKHKEMIILNLGNYRVALKVIREKIILCMDIIYLYHTAGGDSIQQAQK